MVEQHIDERQDQTNDHGEAKEVQILVNNRPVTVPHRTNGRQIMSLAGVPADFQLFLIHGTNEEQIGADQTIEVHPGERFIASPTLDPS